MPFPPATRNRVGGARPPRCSLTIYSLPRTARFPSIRHKDEQQARSHRSGPGAVRWGYRSQARGFTVYQPSARHEAGCDPACPFACDSGGNWSMAERQSGTPLRAVSLTGGCRSRFRPAGCRPARRGLAQLSGRGSRSAGGRGRRGQGELRVGRAEVAAAQDRDGRAGRWPGDLTELSAAGGRVAGDGDLDELVSGSGVGGCCRAESGSAWSRSTASWARAVPGSPPVIWRAMARSTSGAVTQPWIWWPSADSTGRPSWP